MANLVGDISVASNEQASGIAQVNQGIIQVSEVIQTNSATSEESAAASEELSSLAEILKEQVSRFKLRRSYDSNSPSYTVTQDIIKRNKKQNTEAYSRKFSSDSKNITLSQNEFGKY